MTMTKVEKDLFDEKIKGLTQLLNSHNELLNQRVQTMEDNIGTKIENMSSKFDQKLSSIEIQTTKTNGRVNKIEEELVPYRFFMKYPKVVILGGGLTVIGGVLMVIAKLLPLF